MPPADYSGFVVEKGGSEVHVEAGGRDMKGQLTLRKLRLVSSWLRLRLRLGRGKGGALDQFPGCDFLRLTEYFPKLNCLQQNERGGYSGHME